MTSRLFRVFDQLKLDQSHHRAPLTAGTGFGEGLGSQGNGVYKAVIFVCIDQLSVWVILSRTLKVLFCYSFVDICG